MKYKQLILSLSLFLTTSAAIKCYDCTQLLSKSDKIYPGSCAGGIFESKPLNTKISIVDCRNSTFCSKIAGTMPDGSKTYHRSCPYKGDDFVVEEHCVEAKDFDGYIHRRCACNTDLCNGATDLTAGHAVVGLVTSIVATVFATQY